MPQCLLLKNQIFKLLLIKLLYKAIMVRTMNSMKKDIMKVLNMLERSREIARLGSTT